MGTTSRNRADATQDDRFFSKEQKKYVALNNVTFALRKRQVNCLYNNASPSGVKTEGPLQSWKLQ